MSADVPDSVRARAVEAGALAMQNCCDECALDPDGGSIRDARDVLDAVLPVLAEHYEAQRQDDGERWAMRIALEERNCETAEAWLAEARAEVQALAGHNEDWRIRCLASESELAAARAKLAAVHALCDTLESQLLDTLRFGDPHKAKLSPNEVVHVVLRQVRAAAGAVGSETS